MSDIEVSVIIPTHQRRQLLEQVIGRLNAQTFSAHRYEVIVVVDGSTDGTLEMLKQMETACQLRPAYQRQSGPSVARNYGASLARGRVLLFLDDDILAEPELLERHWEVHAGDEAAVVLGKLLPAHGEAAAGMRGWSIWEARILEKHFEAMQTGRRPPAGRRLYSGNVSVSRELFLTVGGFDEQLSRGEDVEMGLRLQDAGARFYFAPLAAGVHCGFRTFESWVTSSYLYGRCDVRLTQDKGRDTLGLVLSWYNGQRPLVRAALAVGLRRPWMRRAMVQAIHRAAGVLMSLGLTQAALAGYGAIYKLQYWQGVMDQLGGRQALVALAKAWREGRLGVAPGNLAV